MTNEWFVHNNNYNDLLHAKYNTWHCHPLLISNVALNIIIILNLCFKNRSINTMTMYIDIELIYLLTRVFLELISINWRISINHFSINKTLYSERKSFSFHWLERDVLSTEEPFSGGGQAVHLLLKDHTLHWISFNLRGYSTHDLFECRGSSSHWISIPWNDVRSLLLSSPGHLRRHLVLQCFSLDLCPPHDRSVDHVQGGPRKRKLQWTP